MVTTKTELGREAEKGVGVSLGRGRRGGSEEGLGRSRGEVGARTQVLGDGHSAYRRGRPGEGPGPERAGGQLALTDGGTLSNSFSLSGPRFPHVYCRI